MLSGVGTVCPNSHLFTAFKCGSYPVTCAMRVLISFNLLDAFLLHGLMFNKWNNLSATVSGGVSNARFDRLIDRRLRGVFRFERLEACFIVRILHQDWVDKNLLSALTGSLQPPIEL